MLSNKTKFLSQTVTVLTKISQTVTVLTEISQIVTVLTKILKYCIQGFFYYIRNLGIYTFFPNLEIGSLAYFPCGNRFPW